MVRKIAAVTVDTTVQPKAVTFPTDAKLLERAIQQLGSLAKKHGVAIRQSYTRLAKRAALMAGRYSHAKQYKRRNQQIAFLRTRLGRLIRDIRRKIGDDPTLKEIFAEPLAKAGRIRRQQQRQRGPKLPSTGLRGATGATLRSQPGMPPRPSASAKARQPSPTSSASRSRLPPPIGGLRAANSSSTPRRCRAILTTAIP